MTTRSEPPAFANGPPSRQAIVRAARKLFVRDGYDVITIRQIADEAGYTNPALFKFFKSKEELAVHLFEVSYRQVLDRVEPFFLERGPVENVLERWVDAFIQLLVDHVDAFLFVHDHLAQFWPKVSRRFGEKTLFALMREWVLRGRRAGEISDAVSVEVQLASVSGFFHQLARMIYLGEMNARAIDRLKQDAREVLFRILKP